MYRFPWLSSAIRGATSALVLLLCSSVAHAQRDFSNVEIIAHPVAGNVYYLEGAGGNIGVTIGEDGVVMIDDQYAPLTDRIVAAIRELTDQEIRFLINTHVHGDHTGGNENLGRMGVIILARDEVRVRLAQQSPAAALPVLTYSEAITIHLNGEEVFAFPVPPAHTDGDTFIHFRDSDVIHAGDVFRTTAYPVIDTNNGGTLDGTLQALALLIGTAGPETRIIPGHGQVSDRLDVMAFRDMVLEVRSRVAPLVDQGMSYADVVAANPTAAYNDRYGDPDRFLRAVYSELGGESP
ncbi:MAG: MBL fold metallo-hydrolase [Pseudohongiellaceae bacterium]|jgi:glyoxylase-like metal-dependent hydrolase (beta-lactamase superfamily II)